jgi:hypothetical protein
MNPGTLLAATINSVILAVIGALSLWFVGRDARTRGLSWLETIAWTVLSIFTFPIGFGLYFLWRPGSRRGALHAPDSRESDGAR